MDGRGRAMQPLRPQTINSHLHLLAEILARAVREGLLARNPAEGEDLRYARTSGFAAWLGAVTSAIDPSPQCGASSSTVDSTSASAGTADG